MTIDEILDRFSLKYEDLNFAEQETLLGWLKTLSKRPVTAEEVKFYIRKLITQVEQEMTDVENIKKSGRLLFYIFFYWKRDFMLKARLRNYLLLEAFLTGPERAKEALENYLKNLERGGVKK